MKESLMTAFPQIDIGDSFKVENKIKEGTKFSKSRTQKSDGKTIKYENFAKIFVQKCRFAQM